MNSTDFTNLVNQNTSESHASYLEVKYVSIAVFFCLVGLVGLPLNIFSIWVFFCRMPKWKAGTVLQFHLAISDIIICLLTPVMGFYFSQGEHWPFGCLMCQLKMILMTVHFYASVLFLTLVSIHRYVSVVYHTQDSCMKQKNFVHKLCLGVWVAMFFEGTLFVFLLDTCSTTENRVLCFNIHQGQNIEMDFVFTFILVFLSFLIPFTVSVFCYGRILRSVCRISVYHQKGKIIKSKTCKMVAVCMLIFGVCFVPLNVVHTVIVVVKKFFPNHHSLPLQVEIAYSVTWIISLVHCCLDPLIYCFASEKFSKAVHSSIRRIRTGIQTARRDSEQDGTLTLHINPSVVTNKRETVIITDTH